MTQVLIRRTLFDKRELFPISWDAVGVSAWQIKIGLGANVVNISEKLAMWRYYEGQGSGRVYQKAIPEGWLYGVGINALERFNPLASSLAKGLFVQVCRTVLFCTDFIMNEKQRRAYSYPYFPEDNTHQRFLVCLVFT